MLVPDLAVLRRRLSGGPLDGRLALFEAAVMLRCVTQPLVGATGAGRPARPAGIDGPMPENLTYFDTQAAAHRFAATLRHGAGVCAAVETRTHGIRHRHELHSVRVGEPTRQALCTALTKSWLEARSVLSAQAVAPQVRSPRRLRLAASVWRAVLLASTPVRNAPGLRLRIRDADLLALLVRAGHLLGVEITVRSTPGTSMISVDRPEDVATLVDLLSGAHRHHRADPSTHRPAATPRPSRLRLVRDTPRPAPAR